MGSRPHPIDKPIRTHADDHVKSPCCVSGVNVLSDLLGQDPLNARRSLVLPCQRIFVLLKGLQGPVLIVRSEKSDAIRDYHASNALIEDKHSIANERLFG